MATKDQSPENEPREVIGTPAEELLAPSRAEEFLEQNRKILLISVPVILLAVIVGIIINAVMEAKREEAAIAFADAENVEELSSVADQYGNTVAGGNALIRQAALLESQDDPAQAKTVYLEFLRDHGKHPRKEQVLVAMGRLFMDEGDSDQALGYFQQVGSEHDLAPFACMKEADILVMKGDYEEARQSYQSIYQEYPGNAWFSQIQEREEDLKKYLPDMEVTDAADPEVPAYPVLSLPKEAPKPEPAPPAPAPAETAPPAQESPAPAAEMPAAPATDAPTETPAPPASPDAPAETPAPAEPEAAEPEASAPAEVEMPATPSPNPVPENPAPAVEAPAPPAPAKPADTPTPETPAAAPEAATELEVEEIELEVEETTES